MDSEEDFDVPADHDDIDEDIKLLKIVLEDEDNHDEFESDGELQVLEQNDDEHVSHASISRPSTSTDYTVSSFPTTSMGTDADDLVYKIDHSSINPETCLAMNRAYQEVLLDTLRQIEMSLAENRLKQRELSESLDEKSKKPAKGTSSTTHKFVLKTPFFSDGDDKYDVKGDNNQHPIEGASQESRNRAQSAKIPPFNSDVQQKVSMQEDKQHVKPRLGWPKKSRKKLLSAIKNDALEQEVRPILNKLELESSKLMECKNDEEIKATKAKIEELREEVKQKQKIPADELLNKVNSDKIDYLKISALTFDGRYSAPDCESMWRNVLHPSINRDGWTLEEDEKLVELVKKNNLRNWKTIAKDLGTSRTPFQCFQHYQLNSVVYDTSEWKPEEDELLREVVETCKYGSSKVQWSQVAFYVDMRSANQCRIRWRKINPNARHGRWSNKEDCLLISAVDKYGVSDWARISEHVPGRTGIQCRDRYLNSVFVAHNPWTYDEDKKFLKLYEQYKNFATVTLYMPKRTETNLSMRYNKLKEWESEWNNFCALPRPVQEDQMSLKFRLSQNGEIVSAKSLVTWTKQELEKGKKARDIAKEQKSFRKYFSKPNIMRTWEESEWNEYANHNQICEEDYCRQEEDRMTNDIIVPRPPPVKVKGPTSKYKKERHRLGRLIEGQVEKACMKMEMGQSTEKSNTLRGEVQAAIQPLFDKEARKKFVEEKVDEIIKQYWYQGTVNMSVRNILRVIRGDLNSKFAEMAHTKREKRLRAKKQKQKWQESSSEEKEESDSEKSSEEDEETNEGEEENDEEVIRHKAQHHGPITQKEFYRKQIARERVDERKIATDLLKEAIRAKLPVSDQLSRKKIISMYPKDVLQKIKLMTPDDQQKQQYKCIALLMKSFDVNTEEVYRNASEARRKHSARALLNMARPLGRTRLSNRAIARGQTNNEIAETADLALGIKGETEPQIDTEEDTENEGASDKTSNQTEVKVKIEADPDADAAKMYESYDKCLPYIPPNFSNMAAMKTLLLEHRRTVDNAGYYFDKHELRNRLYKLKEKGPNLFMNVIGSVGTLKGIKGKKKPQKKKTEAEIQVPFVDVIKHIRKTRSYQQLKARFQAAFCWPALMAIVQPPNSRARPPQHIFKIRKAMEVEKEEMQKQAAKDALEKKKALQKLEVAHKTIRTINEQVALHTSTQTSSDREDGANNSFHNHVTSSIASEKTVSSFSDQGTSCEMERNEQEGDEMCLDDCIKQVILMCGEEYVDTGIEEEAINKLVDRIMNVYRERRESNPYRVIAGKPRKRKKQSASMAAGVDSRERIKILKRLNLYDKYMQIQKAKQEKEGLNEEETEEIQEEEGPRKRGRPKGSKNNCNILADENTRKSARQELIRAKVQQLEVYEECGLSPTKKPHQDLRQFRRGPDDPYVYDLKAMMVTDKKPQDSVKAHKSSGIGTIDLDRPVKKKEKSRVVKPKTVSFKKKNTEIQNRPGVINVDNDVEAETENPLIVIEFSSPTKRKLTSSDAASQDDPKAKKQRQSNTQACGVDLNKFLIKENLVRKITDKNKNNESGVLPKTSKMEVSSYQISPSDSRLRNGNQIREKIPLSISQPAITNIVPMSTSQPASKEKALESNSLPAYSTSQLASTETASMSTPQPASTETVPMSTSQPAGTETVPMSIPQEASAKTVPMSTLQPASTETILLSTSHLDSAKPTSSQTPTSIDTNSSSASQLICSTELPLEPQNVSSAVEAEEQAIAKNLQNSNRVTEDADKSDGSLDLKNVEPVLVGVPVMIGGTQQTAWLPVYPGKDGKLMRDKDGKIIVPNAMVQVKMPERP